ncbi:unnamed protein product [Rhizophagus irregularis]|uniref:Uncharacterized protein n=1 Tax=Rhizophagus irregularis TaxID=588596 RepID=A0A915Z9X5_9GLOM|nr:unnamed protein product [Rhizophagus irregularis]
MIAPRVHAQILGVEILYHATKVSAYKVTKNCETNSSETNLDNSNEDDFDTSNGNNIDLTEFDEPSEKSESSLNLIIKPSTGSASQSK